MLTKWKPPPEDAVVRCYRGDCTLLEDSKYDDITKITTKNEAIYIRNVIDLLIEMVVWNSDLGPPQNHKMRLTFRYKYHGPPKNNDTLLSPPHQGLRSSPVAERPSQPSSNESLTPSPQVVYFSIKRKALADPGLIAAIKRISSSKKDIPGPSNLSGLSIVPKNSKSSRNHRPRARRYTWLCCQCGSGPSEINCVTDCLDCYHPRCASCSVATTKS
jgi:hypothetical protein